MGGWEVTTSIVLAHGNDESRERGQFLFLERLFLRHLILPTLLNPGCKYRAYQKTDHVGLVGFRTADLTLARRALQPLDRCGSPQTWQKKVLILAQLSLLSGRSF